MDGSGRCKFSSFFSVGQTSNVLPSSGGAILPDPPELGLRRRPGVPCLLGREKPPGRTPPGPGVPGCPAGMRCCSGVPGGMSGTVNGTDCWVVPGPVSGMTLGAVSGTVSGMTLGVVLGTVSGVTLGLVSGTVSGAVSGTVTGADCGTVPGVVLDGEPESIGPLTPCAGIGPPDIE